MGRKKSTHSQNDQYYSRTFGYVESLILFEKLYSLISNLKIEKLGL